jgi:hypothetical protein
MFPAVQIDVIGAVFAGLAMTWTLLALFVGWELAGGYNQAGVKLNFAAPFAMARLFCSASLIQ